MTHGGYRGDFRSNFSYALDIGNEGTEDIDHCPWHERYTCSPTTLTYRPPEGLRQLYEDRNHAVDKELNRLRKADQRALAKWKKGALETVKVNCEVRGPDGTWHYGSKTDDVPTSGRQSVVLADGTNLAQVASDDIRALKPLYIGTKIEALDDAIKQWRFDDETKEWRQSQWRAAVVISVVPKSDCTVPCSSTTVKVAFLDAGTATFTGVANLQPGNTLPCCCFNKIGCFDCDSCTCYVGNKDEDTFCVKTGDAGLGGYCESCDAARALHKNRLRKADQRALAKWKKDALETVNCEVRGPDGTWHYGSKTDDVPTSGRQSVVLADGTNLAQVASDDIRALTSLYIGTKIEALDDETKQWQAAVVISVVPNTDCTAPGSSTTVMVAFLDAGTATFTGVANLKPGNILPCRCFSKIGCFDSDSCTCYFGNKDEDTFCVKTGDASLGGYCESCDAARALHKKEQFAQGNHDKRNCARCINAFNKCQCLDLETLMQLKEVDPLRIARRCSRSSPCQR